VASSVDPNTQKLFAEGYAIFERAYPAEEIALLREELVSAYHALGRPRCYSPHPEILAPFVQTSPTGLTIAKLVERWPAFACFLLKQPVVDAIRGYLGEDMHLELIAAVLADEHRPFFPWYTHIGGQDDTHLRLRGRWPTMDRPLRVGTLMYLDGLTDEDGPLLLSPRSTGSSTAPAHDPETPRWPGAVRVRVPPGSLVVMDECTWHTALQKTSPGLRILVGCNFAAAAATPSPLVEGSLHLYSDRCALLRSCVRPLQVPPRGEPGSPRLPCG
jgi:hypothetical protein